MLEVTQGQRTDGGVDGLARAQAGIVGFGEGSPVAVHAVDRQDVIGIAHGFEIDEKRRMAQASQSHRREQRALHAMSGAHAQNHAGRIAGGAVRLLVYRNVADMGSYREAIDAFRAGIDPMPDITAHRRQGRTKTGCGLNVEQEVSDAVRVFGRWGVNDGRNESFAYTEVDGTLELGADLRLRHEQHKLGVALVDNRLSTLHSTYLALGGLGFLLGDGRLSYGHEQIIEGYYTYRIWRGLSAAVDLQHIRNPGYNRDRGPAWVHTVRGHVDF